MLCLISSQVVTLHAQNIQRACSSGDLYIKSLKQDPVFRQNRITIDAQLKKYHSNQGFRNNGQINIPVVVHVVYNTPDQNISDRMIQSQIDILNQDFGQLQSTKYKQASKSNIRFALASSDPKGYQSTGITRTFTSIQKFQTGALIMSSEHGGADPWPSTAYLNIWVGNLAGVLGFAYMPGSRSDGVVIGHQFFGENNTVPFNLGRTTTHEVGHWLNLFHTWGLNGGCEADDEVEDTPNSSGPNYGCSLDHTSCGGIDMVENYMDYSDDACMSLFTAGQVDRMKSLFLPGGFRASLLTSKGLTEGVLSAIIPAIDLCSNGIQDHGETGIDCGGSCRPCPCLGQGLFSLFDYIQSIQLNDSISITGENEGIYNSNSATFMFYRNKKNAFMLTPGIPAEHSKEYWSIWVDWNKDGFFNQDELIYKNNSIGPLKDSIDLQVLFKGSALPSLDTYPMRIQMQWGAYGHGCDTFDFGEVENYQVILKEVYQDPCSNGIQDVDESGVDCGPHCKPCAIPYCDSKGNVSKYEFIQSVTLGKWDNISGNNQGYADFTSSSIQIQAGENLEYRLSAGFGGQFTLSENWYVWADWNRDGDFEDDQEKLLAVSSAIPLSGTWKIPDQSTGRVRLRIQMRDSKKENACGQFGYGEVEDYTIEIIKTQNKKSDPTQQLELEIYPNPVHSVLNIKFSKPIQEKLSIYLVNDLGQTYDLPNHMLPGDLQCSMDCHAIPPGILTLEIIGKQERWARRLIIAH